MRLVLVHAPAVGPSTWGWVATVLRARGHEVVVPDLRPAVATGDPAAFVADASTAVAPGDAVVGHSGAGPLLAAIAASTGRPVFVDAGLPTDGPDPFLPRLRDLAVAGVLPPWSTWFGTDTLAALVPDAGRRAAIQADEPQVPLAFYEADRPGSALPDHAGYLLLSDAYRTDAERARALGWPVAVEVTSHLGLVTHPERVADAVARLLEV